MILVNQTEFSTKKLRVDLYKVSKVAHVRLRDVLVRVTAKKTTRRLGTCRAFREAGYKCLVSLEDKEYKVRAYIILYFKNDYQRMLQTFAHELYHLKFAGRYKELKAKRGVKKLHQERKATKFAAVVYANLNSKE